MLSINDIQVRVGDYVQVTATPRPCDGLGELDRDHYVGHVGVIIEVDDWMAPPCLCLVRFPDRDEKGTYGQRVIEEDALELISSPANPLPEDCIF